MEESPPLHILSRRGVMDARLSKAELLSGLKVLQAAQLNTQVVSDKAEQGARTEVKREYEQTRSLEVIAIARAEMARGRRRLGTLTREQEVAIENLLLSTVNRISELVGKGSAYFRVSAS